MSDAMACKLCGGRPHAVVAARWSFEVQRDAPSQNVLATNSGKSRWSYKRERDAWTRLLTSVRTAKAIPLATKARRVSIVRRYSGRMKLRDMDNLIGGFKPARDAMKLAGLIVDDSPHWLEAYYHQERVDGDSGTLITIEELS